MKTKISLFETLDGYILYNDLYHIRKSIEQNIPEKKLEYQISDQKRRNLDVRVRETRPNMSTKEREAANPKEERQDYPEVTPTAMSLFICKLCGKDFQNQATSNITSILKDR
jgi:transposase-like protein